MNLDKFSASGDDSEPLFYFIFWMGFLSLGAISGAFSRFFGFFRALLGPLAAGIGFSSKSYAELLHRGLTFVFTKTGKK